MTSHPIDQSHYCPPFQPFQWHVAVLESSGNLRIVAIMESEQRAEFVSKCFCDMGVKTIHYKDFEP